MTMRKNLYEELYNALAPITLEDKHRELESILRHHLPKKRFRLRDYLSEDGKELTCRLSGFTYPATSEHFKEVTTGGLFIPQTNIRLEVDSITAKEQYIAFTKQKEKLIKDLTNKIAIAPKEERNILLLELQKVVKGKVQFQK